MKSLDREADDVLVDFINDKKVPPQNPLLSWKEYLRLRRGRVLTQEDWDWFCSSYTGMRDEYIIRAMIYMDTIQPRIGRQPWGKEEALKKVVESDPRILMQPRRH